MISDFQVDRREKVKVGFATTFIHSELLRILSRPVDGGVRRAYWENGKVVCTLVYFGETMSTLPLCLCERDTREATK